MKQIRNKGKNLMVTYDGIDYEIPGDGDTVEGEQVLGLGVVTEVPDDVAVHISRTYAHLGCQIVHQAEERAAAATAAARPPRRRKSDKPKSEPKPKATAKSATGSAGATKAVKKASRKKK